MVKCLPELEWAKRLWEVGAVGVPVDGTSTRRFKNHAKTKSMPIQNPCQPKRGFGKYLTIAWRSAMETKRFRNCKWPRFVACC